MVKFIDYLRLRTLPASLLQSEENLHVSACPGLSWLVLGLRLHNSRWQELLDLFYQELRSTLASWSLRSS